MLVRKINAGVSLISTFLLLGHAIFNAVWMLSRGGIAKPIDFMPWVLTGLVVIHAFIGIDQAISAHMEEGGNQKYKQYPKMNVSTLIQRISGVLMVIFAGLHIAGATKFLQPPKIIHGILPPLFFVIVLVHTAVSTSKAFISLGIGTAKFIKILDIVIKVICGITLMADIIGFYLYLW